MVYKSAELHLVQDDSEDFQETWLFLDGRLPDVAAFGKFKTDVSVVGKTILYVSRSKYGSPSVPKVARPPNQSMVEICIGRATLLAYLSAGQVQNVAIIHLYKHT